MWNLKTNLTCEENTLGSLAQLGRDPLVANNIQASLRPLTLECESSLPLQMPFSMPSPPTPLYSDCPVIHNLVILLITHFMTH